jgi:5-methylcytosine-specific restriction endonuclease McrA
MKPCSRCRTEKEESEFSANRAMSDGLDHYCRQCRKKLKSSSYWKAKSREYDKTPKAKSRYRKYRLSEKGKLTEKRKRDRYRSTEKGREANRRSKLVYYYRDPAYHKAKASARFHSTTLEVLRVVRERDEVCQMCGAEENLQFDHVHPVSLGGVASEENLQLLCGSCNGFKRDNLLLPGGGMLLTRRKDRKPCS